MQRKLPHLSPAVIINIITSAFAGTNSSDNHHFRRLLCLQWFWCGVPSKWRSMPERDLLLATEGVVSPLGHDTHHWPNLQHSQVCPNHRMEHLSSVQFLPLLASQEHHLSGREINLFEHPADSGVGFAPIMTGSFHCACTKPQLSISK